MRTGFDFFRGSNGFLDALDFLEHLFEALFISFLFWNGKLFNNLVVKLFYL